MKNSNRKKTPYSLNSKKNKRLANKKKFSERKNRKNKTRIIKKNKPSKIFYGGMPSTTGLFNISKYIKDYVKNGDSRINPKTISVYNSSISFMEYNTTGDGYFFCVSRVNFYVKKNSSGDIVALDDSDVDELYSVFNNYITLSTKNQGREDEFVDYPGSIFNKWNTPYGFWKQHPNKFVAVDRTVAAILISRPSVNYPAFLPFSLEYVVDTPRMLSTAPIDSRVFNIFNNIKIPVSVDKEWYVNSFYITGNRDPFSLTQYPSPASVKFTRAVKLEVPDNSMVDMFDSIKKKYITVPTKEEFYMKDVTPANNLRRHIVYPESRSMDWNGELTNDDQTTRNIGWKQSLTRIQIVRQHDVKIGGDTSFAFAFPHQLDSPRNPFTHLEVSNQESLANSISWDINTEKNYILHYFKDNDPKRKFCNKKCMILQYCLSGKIPNVYVSSSDDTFNPNTIAFYYKEFDSTLPDADSRVAGYIDNVLSGRQFETELDKSWKLHIPQSINDNYYSRLERYYKSANFKVSGSTPFIELDDSLIAVGHAKFNIYKYINKKIEEFLEEFNLTSITEIGPDEWNAIVNYYSGKSVEYKGKTIFQRTQNNLFVFGITILEKFGIIYNNATHGINGDGKYIQKINNINDTFWTTNGKLPSFLYYKHVINIMKTHYHCLHEESPNTYLTIRNIHPDWIYTMFFYKLNKFDLTLQASSDFFLFLNDANCSFLNFPMGLTNFRTKEEDYFLLSYGEGDHDSYVAPFKKNAVLSDLAWSYTFQSLGTFKLITDLPVHEIDDNLI